MGVGDVFALIAVLLTVFIGLPGIILHYVTQWKKGGGGLSVEDEKLLDELYELGRRLDERVATIERIMTAENPGWRQLSGDTSGLVRDERQKIEGRITQ